MSGASANGFAAHPAPGCCSAAPRARPVYRFGGSSFASGGHPFELVVRVAGGRPNEGRIGGLDSMRWIIGRAVPCEPAPGEGGHFLVQGAESPIRSDV